MKTSLFATIAIAVAASVVSLSPALADRGHRGHDHKFERKYDRGYGYSKHNHYRKHRHFGAHKYWGKRRWYGYGYNPYSRWN
ncbi:MAG: hypothetical protein K2Y42_08445 [Hyphomicrobium sp.]|jgi:hypothetical protein|uniref:hypothetical protein n=1 Tax=Hyphomicrobium sp. TaxID=82 RepID=UPI0025C4C49E|nr:hypothetical protein [Hyphomicrobium sp.]MBX9862767.1 hypothetical protein [Hyphomicrobium sp.]